MRVHIVLNRGGGTLRTMDLDDFCRKAEAIFAEAGHDCTCRAVDGDRMDEALRTAAASDAEAIVAGGGDGTISAAAAIAFASGKPLGVLPAGTMNLFARALGVPLDLEQALWAIAPGEVDRIDIATANGRPFVHQFGVGIHARLVRIRNQMIYRSRIGKMLASLRAISAAVINPPRFTVDLMLGGQKSVRSVSGIVVSNNRLGNDPVPVAETLDGGVLGVYVAASVTTGELVNLMFDIFTGRWRANRVVSEAEATELTLHFPKRKHRTHAVIDGELITLDRDVDLRIQPRALRVIRPRDMVDEAPSAAPLLT